MIQLCVLGRAAYKLQNWEHIQKDVKWETNIELFVAAGDCLSPQKTVM